MVVFLVIYLFFAGLHFNNNKMSLLEQFDSIVGKYEFLVNNLSCTEGNFFHDLIKNINFKITKLILIIYE